jgi:2-isopropylmalate synthase
MSEKIYIFDTTLRDGEQSAGVAFTADEKLEIAHQLARLGVDVIEAGFPCTSEGDFEAVKRIAKEVRGPVICGLARAVERDIDIAWEALKEADSPRIHVFINTSDIQMAHQLRRGREEVLEQAGRMVERAASYCPDIEFSPMDATRSDREFLCKMIETAIENGATTINVPDSVGYAIPEETAAMFDYINANVPNIDKARLSFHGQNDLGLCTANTLTAIQHGVRQVEVTINGIGERAGNTSLEEVVMAIKTRGDFLPYYTDIDTTQLWAASQLVQRHSGMPVQFNKAVVGRNAFRHGSGIHQDGILKMRETWEIMDPRDIGVPGGSQLVMGKLSGRHAFFEHVRELGYKASDETLNAAFRVFKQVADRKAAMTNDDIALVMAKAGATAISASPRAQA